MEMLQPEEVDEVKKEREGMDLQKGYWTLRQSGQGLQGLETWRRDLSRCAGKLFLAPWGGFGYGCRGLV